jgi:hypothetical protein
VQRRELKNPPKHDVTQREEHEARKRSCFL